MQIQLLTLHFDPARAAFDTGPLDEHMRDHAVVEFREHFFVADGLPHLLCVLSLRAIARRPTDQAVAPAHGSTTTTVSAPLAAPRKDAAGLGPPAAVASAPPQTPSAPARASMSKRPSRAGALDEVLAQLSPADRECYDALRRWRLHRARNEGLPPYVVLTNKQLLALVRQRPASPTALRTIDRIGAARVQRYGRAILELLHGSASSPEVASTTETAGTTEDAAEGADPPLVTAGATA